MASDEERLAREFPIYDALLEYVRRQVVEDRMVTISEIIGEKHRRTLRCLIP